MASGRLVVISISKTVCSPVAGDAFDRDAREREFVRKTTVVDRKVNEVAEPLGRNFHFSFSAVSYQ